jgi:16S rRNA G1207 methylase RsmC
VPLGGKRTITKFGFQRGICYVGRNLHYLVHWEWGAGAVAAYRRSSKSGVFLRQSEMDMCSLLLVHKLNRIVNLAPPKTILDVGCGTGRTTAYLHKLGLYLLGVEASRIAIRTSDKPDLIYHHDLRLPL